MKFSVPGKPAVWQRVKRGWHGKMYDPCADSKAVIASYAAEARMKSRLAILEGPVSVKFWFYGPRINADGSNLQKLVEDAINRVIYLDDKQIVHWEGWKIPCKKGQERTEVEIITVLGDGP